MPSRLIALAIVFIVVVALVLVMVFAQPSPAPVRCGTTITTDTTLNANVGPCSGNGLTIGASHVVLDCAGHSITGTGKNGTSVGIGLTRMAGVTVRDCSVTKFGSGFYLLSTFNSTLIGDRATGDTRGFFLEGVGNDTLGGNTASGNAGSGFTFVRGIACPGGRCHWYGSINNTLGGNTASDNGGDGLNLTDFFNSTLSGNTASNNTANGFELSSSSGVSALGGSTFTQNTANNNKQNGFFLQNYSDDNTLIMNTADSNRVNGIYLSDSGNNTLTGNTANSDGGYGYDVFAGSGTEGMVNYYAGNGCHGNGAGGSRPSVLCSPQP